MSSQADALREGRSDSLARRPAIANGAVPLAQPGGSGRSEGRKMLTTAARIAVERIESDPEQPRKTFGTEADDRLAENMRTRGQLVPILVRWNPAADRYTVIDGDRRFRAAKRAGLADLACVVEDEADPDAILEVQLIANALREDVAPVEQARAWQRLMDSQGISQTDLAAKLGYSVGAINKRVALLNLPEAIQGAVDAGEIKAETGYFISQMDDPAEQAAMAEEAKAGTLKRDDARQRVARSKARPKGKNKPATVRRFKGPGGLTITAERSKGLDLPALVETFRSLADEIETAMDVN